MQIKKVMVSFWVLVCLCTNFSAVVYADTTAQFSNYGASLLYEIAKAPISTLSIMDKTAYCVSSTTGTNATSITVTQTLQKHWGLWIWNDVKNASWSKQVDDGSIRLSNTKSGLDGGKYRVKSVFTLTDKNGKRETITIYSDEKSV